MIGGTGGRAATTHIPAADTSDAPLPPGAVTAASSLFHRGFDLQVVDRARAGRPAAYHYRLMQDGRTLCLSETAFRTLASAERAARRHVDDALRAYEIAAVLLAEA